jgi:hypothetical protein
MKFKKSYMQHSNFLYFYKYLKLVLLKTNIKILLYLLNNFTYAFFIYLNKLAKVLKFHYKTYV